MTQQCILFSGLCLVWVSGLVAEGSETPRTGSTSKSLSGFESLGDELLQGLPLPKEPQSSPTDSVKSHSSPLERVEHGMRQAQAMLAHQEIEPRVAVVQQKVVTELDALIDQLRKAQCKACQGSKPSESSASRRSKVVGQKPSAGPVIPQSATPKTAQQSSDRFDSGESVSAKNESVDDVLTRLWGQLPERVREQMLQTPVDEFLPKYREEIEKYFRRLAEEDVREPILPPLPTTSPRQ